MNFRKKDLLFSFGMGIFAYPPIFPAIFFRIILAIYFKLNSFSVSTKEYISSDYLIDEKIILSLLLLLSLIIYTFLRTARKGQRNVFILQYFFAVPFLLGIISTLLLFAKPEGGWGYFLSIPLMIFITSWMFAFFMIIKNKIQNVFGKSD